MKKSRFQQIGHLLAVISVAFFLACTRAPKPPTDVADAAPAEIIAAHTSGLVSRHSPIQLRFVGEAVPEESVGVALAASHLFFTPLVPGNAVWTSTQVLEFTPDGDLVAGKRYEVIVDLPALLPQIPGLKAFAFDFGVAVPDFSLAAVGLEADSSDGATQRWRARIELADVAENSLVETMIKARHGEVTLALAWTHEGLAHSFVASGIVRSEASSTLLVEVDGTAIGVARSEQTTVVVPGLNQFLVSSIQPVMGGERLIEIRFSDPLDERQDLRGLVRVVGRTDTRVDRDGSVVRLYATGNWNSTEQVQISGVRNARGYSLTAAIDQVVSFEPIKPQVRFVGSGVILPTSAELTVPLEVVNVRAIEVEATRVYEENVPQFLQVNDLDGNEELRRVGAVVWRQRVEIAPQPGQSNRWVRVGLDLTSLVQRFPAGLYRLHVRFDRPDIVWECGTSSWDVAEKRPERPWDSLGADGSFWDMWTGGEDGEEWAWSERDDPCEKSYYTDFGWNNHGQTASRNVIVSDVGLLARQGVGGAVDIVATDLRSSEPLAGTDIQLLDYQLQGIGKGITDARGMLRLTTEDEFPFAIVAHHGGQASWLRLDRGQARAMSHFDVGGSDVKQGLKGFLYGERGVWRPGDPMHLNFVLFDATDRIPDAHPLDFQLRNPLGQVVETQTVTESVDGFYAIHAQTAGDAPTGRYTASVRVGGAVFQKQLRVEAVIPNRLKIELALPPTGVRAPNLEVQSTLASRWLHGAIAQGLRADIEVQLSPRQTQFATFSDFQFDDPMATFSAEPELVWEGSLDDEGKAAVAATIHAPPSPGLLTATLRTRVFEPSGAASVDEASVSVSPYERYIGVALPKGDKARGMLLTDTKHTVRVVSVDADGKPVGSGKVKLSLRKLQWRWWWEQGEDSDAQFSEGESQHELASGLIDLVDGQGNWEFEVRYPEWGRYVVTATDDKEGGHTTGKIVYIDWPGWAGRAEKDQAGGASVLSLTADHGSVEVGKPVTLTFPMPKGARALVSLESGTRVVQTDWVPPSDGGTGTFTFVATPEMTPNVYANVTVLQPHQNTANDAPMRMYATTPILVFDPETKLAPHITTSDSWEPSSLALVSVNEEHGRAMTYTLAVVDEGLLGLTRFETPNPWDTFYAREALGVRTWDIYGAVVGATGGTIEQMLAIGGDGEGQSNKRPKAQRFKPVVWVGGPYRLEAGATDRREIPIPQYVGEVRVMVVAGRGGAFGTASQTVPVRTSLMALATLPRVLGPSESVELPVSIFANDPKVKSVTVSVTTEGPISLVDSGPKTLRFPAAGEQMVSFRIRVADGLGVGKVTVKATGGGETSEQTLEVDVRHPGSPVTRTSKGTVPSKGTWSTNLGSLGLVGSNSLSIEISRVPPLGLDHRLDALIRYPHGCVEQTTSAAFPQVALDRLLELTPGEAADVAKHVKAAISKLRSFQNTDGSFGYWPGEPANSWSTTYVGHFLLEAERAGYPLPSGMRASWARYQRDQAERWTRSFEGADLDQAYRLYTLALSGNPEVGAMNRLRESVLSPPARWRLAAAWSLAGQASTAREVASSATLDVRTTRELSGTLASPMRDRALILESLILLGDLGRATTLAATLSNDLVSDDVLSTQETAFALVAMSRFGDVGAGPGETKATWSMAGGPASAVTSSRVVARVLVDAAQIKAGKLVVTSSSGGPLFVTTTLRGLMEPGTDDSISRGIELTVDYQTLEGVPLLADSLEQGQNFVAHITLTNRSGRRLEELALTEIVASGWEIAGASPGKGDGYQYRDVRDDRVYTYLDLEADAVFETSIPLTAAYLGHYYLPSVSVETMYDPTITARVKGQWVDVVQQRIN